MVSLSKNECNRPLHVKQLHSDDQAHQMNAIQNKRVDAKTMVKVTRACQKPGRWAKCCFTTKYDQHRTNSQPTQRSNPYERSMDLNHNRMIRINLAVTLDIFAPEEQCDYGENRSQCNYDDNTAAQANELPFNVANTSISNMNETYARCLAY